MRTKVFILGLICFFVFICCKKNLPTSPDLSSSLKINHFIVTPAQIFYAESSVLSWNVIGALKVVIDSGIGEVSGTGTMEVSPFVTTTYMLTAYGSTDIFSRTVRLEVTPRAILIVHHTDWIGDTQGPNGGEERGCEYIVWFENIGNLTAKNIQIYTKIYDSDGLLLNEKVVSCSYDLPPGEVSYGYLIWWSFALGYCERIATVDFNFTWDE